MNIVSYFIVLINHYIELRPEILSMSWGCCKFLAKVILYNIWGYILVIKNQCSQGDNVFTERNSVIMCVSCCSDMLTCNSTHIRSHDVDNRQKVTIWWHTLVKSHVGVMSGVGSCLLCMYVHWGMSINHTNAAIVT